MWTEYYTGDALTMLGLQLRLDGEPFTVIGVIPREYALDLTDLVVPLRMPPDAGVTYPVHVRVKAGTSMAAAETELQQI